MTDPGMKCTRCRKPADHRFPSHHVHFCDECLEIYLRRQVEKAIHKYWMMPPGHKVLVAVSGGKDSLVLWQVLADLGYEVEGLHVGLGLGKFSEASLASCQAMAQRLGKKLNHVELSEATGFDMAEIVRANRRHFCSVCGTVKRHFVNRLCLELGFDTLAMGQHLDDEAARLLGNMIHQHKEYLARQWPVLEGTPGKFAKKIKPLVRLAGDEIAAYAGTLDLPVCEVTCSKSRGATLTYYQEAMDLMERRMPGTKRTLYFGFLKEKGAPSPSPVIEGFCERCGSPTHVGLCNFCRLMEKTEARRAAESDDLGPADGAA